MNAFEILIKIKPGGFCQSNWIGKMTQYLFTTQVGERQFKIRGPFGSPLLPPIRNYFAPEESYEVIYFFAGGSGITPFLQLALYSILATNVILKVLCRVFKCRWRNHICRR
jgi:NAD(P)H-flavin reductase